MIKSFACADTERLFNRERVKAFEAFEQGARRKLESLNAAKELHDLSAIPGNRLEKLGGKRKDEYSIRVNKQWRITFEWQEGDTHNVKIEDYHA